jgi:tRNA(fMet)-specific endonuclease VapC
MEGSARIQQAIADLGERPSLSAVSRAELEAGVYADDQLMRTRRSLLDVLLRTLAVIDFTDETAIEYGVIVRESGYSRARVRDRMIAATARQHGLALITCNGADFTDVKGLALVVWKAGD